MNPKKTVRDMVNTMKLAKKSDKEDYMQHLRLVLLGIVTVGSIGFVIQFVFFGSNIWTVDKIDRRNSSDSKGRCRTT